jgi:hypothetical protein
VKQRWTCELQAERRRNERPPIDWDTMRRAILAARGAKEGADVAAEQNPTPKLAATLALTAEPQA